eukprot:1118044-Amphidinium_carterae.1
MKRPRTPVSDGCWVGGNHKYVKDLLSKLGMGNCKITPTPSAMSAGGDDVTALDLIEVKVYRSAVGRDRMVKVGPNIVALGVLLLTADSEGALGESLLHPKQEAYH